MKKKKNIEFLTTRLWTKKKKKNTVKITLRSRCESKRQRKSILATNHQQEQRRKEEEEKKKQKDTHIFFNVNPGQMPKNVHID